MSFRWVSLPVVSGIALLLTACERPAEIPRGATEVATAPLEVGIDAMDNAAHVLRGHVQSAREGSRVELYENSVRLGEARVEDGHWSIEWHPREDTRFIEVVASDTRGQSSSTRLDLQPLRFDANTPLYVSEALLTLPTSPTTKTFYTLDGSTPTPASALYEGPLVLLRRSDEPTFSLIPTNPPDSPERWRWLPPQEPPVLAHAVRVQQYQGTTARGASQARTYLMGRCPYSLPVVSLVTDGRHFFDFVQGIYVPGQVHAERPIPDEGEWGTGNYMQDGKEWERPVHVEWFEPSGELLLSQNAGVRIHGASSAVLPQKSVRLYAKSDYGPELFNAPLFPDSSLRGFKRLIVRSAGQDTLETKVRDCALQALLKDSGRALQACRPTVMFLNGEYWGVFELRERYDEYFLASHYGVDKNQVVIVDAEGELDTGSSGDERSFLALRDFITHEDLSLAENYAFVKTQMEVEDFIDYVIAEIYLGNSDWPDNNSRLWHVRTASAGSAVAQQDGRWRWLLFDLDFAADDPPEFNSLEHVLEGSYSELGPALLLKHLLDAPEFKERFVSRFRWHLDNTFTARQVHAQLDSMASVLEPEMNEHIARWNYPSSMESWRASLERLHDYFERRPALMRRMLEERFGPAPDTGP